MTRGLALAAALLLPSLAAADCPTPSDCLCVENTEWAVEARITAQTFERTGFEVVTPLANREGYPPAPSAGTFLDSTALSGDAFEQRWLLVGSPKGVLRRMRIDSGQVQCPLYDPTLTLPVAEAAAASVAADCQAKLDARGGQGRPCDDTPGCGCHGLPGRFAGFGAALALLALRAQQAPRRRG